MKLSKERALPIIKAALKEDIGDGDITTSALVDTVTGVDACIIARDECVVCGVDIAEWTVSQVDYSVRFKPNCADGDRVGAGMEIAYLEGHVGSILRAERTMLNFLTFLSGVATQTRRYVDKARPHGVSIMDTRKTVPLMRYLEKYAVATGGGANHRMGLYDQVLIKDNHIAYWRSAPGKKDPGIAAAVAHCRERVVKGTVIEVEVENLDDFRSALGAGADIIMLDNMPCGDIAACVKLRDAARSSARLEASGGVSLDTVEQYARTKVDMISVGSLTASVKAIDMSLELVIR